MLVAALGLTGLGALGLLRLEIRTDGQALVPRNDPVVRFDAQMREAFGLRDTIVVHLDTHEPGGIFDLGVLERVQRLTDALASIPEIGPRHVMSLATEARPRVFTGTLEFRRLLEPMPDTPQRMEWLRQDLADIQILDGVLVSRDRAGTAVLVGAPPSVSQDPAGVDREALRSEILELVEAHAAGAPVRVSVVGAPIAEALLGTRILEDLAVLVPLAMCVVAGVIWASSRRLLCMLIVLAEAGACLAFTFGAMGWLGVPVYLTTAVLPVILTCIGIADELHILSQYQLEAAREPVAQAQGRTMQAMVRPVTITSLTTALGFLSFLAAPIAAVASFGVFAALGIAFCWLWSLTAMPAALELLGPRWLTRRPNGRGRAAGRFARALAGALDGLLRRPRPVLVGIGLLTGIALVGALKLSIQDSWIDGFATQSPLRLATQRVDAVLNGTHVLHAQITLPERPGEWPKAWKREGPLLSPRVLDAIARFEDGLREEAGVGGVLGPASHLSTVHTLFMAGQAGTRSIPRDPDRVSLVIDRFDHARGIQRRREVIHDDLHRGVVTLLVRGANFQDTARIMKRARELEAEHLSPLGATVDFGGDLAVSQAMIPAIVNTQIGSVLLALVGAMLTIAFLNRSLAMGLLTLAPTAVAVSWLAGAMGFLGIPIGVATSTFCAITLGIGVDYAVHLLERWRLDRAARLGGPATVAAAVCEASPAIVADAAAVALGFGLLGFSRVPANARLGLVIALALVASAALTLVGLAATLVLRSEARGER